MALSTSSTDSNWENFSNLEKLPDQTQDIDAADISTEEESPTTQTTWHMADELQTLKE
jgi:hypothetical protein